MDTQNVNNVNALSMAQEDQIVKLRVVNAHASQVMEENTAENVPRDFLDTPIAQVDNNVFQIPSHIKILFKLCLLYMRFPYHQINYIFIFSL